MTLSASDINAVIRQGLPAAAEFGFVVEQVIASGVICRQRYASTQLRPGGTISGPTIMAVADAAMYAAVLSQLGRMEMALTQNININFLTRPEPADLIAQAEVFKLGRRTVVMDVRIYSEGAAGMVAHATGTYSLPPSGRENPASSAPSGLIT
jgi:uncharacterized protein (TIGR00369 family)